MINSESDNTKQSPMIVLVDALDEVDVGEKNDLVNCICSLATMLPSLFQVCTNDTSGEALQGTFGSLSSGMDS